MTMTAKEVRELQEEREKGREGGKSSDLWTHVPDGTSLMRIGPPWKKEGEFWKERLVHGFWKNKVFCAKNDIDKSTGKPRKCKVCRRLKHLRGDMSDEARALFKLIVQRREGLWNVCFAKFEEKDGKQVVTGIKEPKKFQILQLSPKWDEMLTDFFTEDDYREDSDLGITHLKKGRWIRVKRKGKKKDTEYKFRVLDISPISESSSRRHKMEKTLINLDKVVKGSSDEELESFIEKMEKEARHQVAHKSSSSSEHKKSSSSSEKKSSSSEEEKKKKSSSSSEKKSSSSSEKKKKSSSEEEKKKKSSSSSEKKKSSSSSEDAGKVLKEMKKHLKDGGKSKKKGSSSDEDKKKSSSSEEDKKKSSSSEEEKKSKKKHKSSSD